MRGALVGDGWLYAVPDLVPEPLLYVLVCAEPDNFTKWAEGPFSETRALARRAELWHAGTTGTVEIIIYREAKQ